MTEKAQTPASPKQDRSPKKPRVSHSLCTIFNFNRFFLTQPADEQKTFKKTVKYLLFQIVM